MLNLRAALYYAPDAGKKWELPYLWLRAVMTHLQVKQGCFFSESLLTSFWPYARQVYFRHHLLGSVRLLPVMREVRLYLEEGEEEVRETELLGWKADEPIHATVRFVSSAGAAGTRGDPAPVCPAEGALLPPMVTAAPPGLASPACAALELAAELAAALGIGAGPGAGCQAQGGISLHETFRWENCENVAEVDCLPSIKNAVFLFPQKMDNLNLSALCRSNIGAKCCGRRKKCDFGQGPCGKGDHCAEGLICGPPGTCGIRPGFGPKDSCCAYQGRRGQKGLLKEYCIFNLGTQQRMCRGSPRGTPSTASSRSWCWTSGTGPAARCGSSGTWPPPPRALERRSRPTGILGRQTSPQL